MSTTTKTGIVQSSHQPISTIINHQLENLDDTDYYATAWSEAVTNYFTNNNSNTKQQQSNGKANNNNFIKWGGKGQGGRGSTRYTYQPKDVILNNVNLEYCIVSSNSSSSSSTSAKEQTSGTTVIAEGSVPTAAAVSSSSATGTTVLLNDATLKLLHGGHVYALIGPSGCGKSSLLRRIAAYKIPGFPTHLSTLYIPQEMILPTTSSTSNDSTTDPEQILNPIRYIQQQYSNYIQQYTTASKVELDELENRMELLDMANEDDQMKMEDIANCIAEIEDEIQMDDDTNDQEKEGASNNNNNNNTNQYRSIAEDALRFMDVPENYWDAPITIISEGLRKKIVLAVSVAVARTRNVDLILFDEPTNGLDVVGLIKLRELMSILSSSSASSSSDDTTSATRRTNSSTGSSASTTTILMVSHDIDFINSVATDIIDWYSNQLCYYAGNYADYRKVRQQQTSHLLRQSALLEKKRENIKETISNLKKKKNTRRQIESHKKKFVRAIAEDYSNDTLQNNSTELNAYRYRYDDSTEPDKAIQFVFPKVTSQWNEPLVMAMDVGHTFQPNTTGTESMNQLESLIANESVITKKAGYLFDCIDLCIEEGNTYCIIGENSCGKSTLLKLLSKILQPPSEGKILHANNIDLIYIDQETIDSYLLPSNTAASTINASGINITEVPVGSLNVLEYLIRKYPKKTNQEIRTELANYGLSSQQQVNAIPIRFLSGGERRRLCFADMILQTKTPHVLILDEPTCNLDVDSVNALIYGIQQWNGTTIIVSHDFHFIRSIQAKCYLLSPKEGKLFRIEHGIDSYLKAFTKT